MEKIKYKDLACEFCEGSGEFSRDNSDGVAVEGDCIYCDGTGIDKDQLVVLNKDLVDNFYDACFLLVNAKKCVDMMESIPYVREMQLQKKINQFIAMKSGLRCKECNGVGYFGTGYFKSQQCKGCNGLGIIEKK